MLLPLQPFPALQKAFSAILQYLPDLCNPRQNICDGALSWTSEEIFPTIFSDWFQSRMRSHMLYDIVTSQLRQSVRKSPAVLLVNVISFAFFR